MTLNFELLIYNVYYSRPSTCYVFLPIRLKFVQLSFWRSGDISCLNIMRPIVTLNVWPFDLKPGCTRHAGNLLPISGFLYSLSIAGGRYWVEWPTDGQIHWQTAYTHCVLGWGRNALQHNEKWFVNVRDSVSGYTAEYKMWRNFVAAGRHGRWGENVL